MDHALVDSDLELRRGGWHFRFACLAGFCSLCDFFFPKIRGGGGRGSLLDPPLGWIDRIDRKLYFHHDSFVQKFTIFALHKSRAIGQGKVKYNITDKIKSMFNLLHTNKNDYFRYQY